MGHSNVDGAPSRLVGIPYVVEEVGEIFPEEFAAVDDFAVADVEQVDGEGAGLKVIAEDVGVVVLLDSGDALFFLELMHG